MPTPLDPKLMSKLIQLAKRKHEDSWLKDCDRYAKRMEQCLAEACSELNVDPFFAMLLSLFDFGYVEVELWCKDVDAGDTKELTRWLQVTEE